MRWILLCLALCPFGARSGEMTPKEIFAKYQTGIVQIMAGGNNSATVSTISSGTGFVISSAGVVLTANHVITTKDFRTYLSPIKVRFFNNRTFDAVPVMEKPTDDSIANDYGILKVNPVPDFPISVLKLGAAAKTATGDRLTTIGYALQPFYPLLISAMVSGYSSPPVSRGPIIVFQGPATPGLSGAPLISNATGNVVGIVSQGAVDSLFDKLLTSGMGNAATIDHAKAAIAAVLER
jgi:S1-C subfamily serine protease